MMAQQNVKSQPSRSTISNPSMMYFTGKRCIDIVVSLILLLVLTPGFLFLMYWLNKREGKPIFYREQKSGKDFSTFIMWTFRTMSPPSRVIRAFPPRPVPRSWEEGVPNTFSIQKNGYTTITNTGYTLRKYRLHKLPLLFHVLKGEMSLVGPEAEIPEITTHYNARQKTRLKMKPGITGYAQINGCSNKNHNEKTSKDLYYIQHCSYWFDLKILWKYIKQVFGK